MTTHVAAEHSSPVHAAESHAPAAGGLLFEKSELHEFVEADRSAGEHVGIMLAVIFFISLGLFVSVTTWMMYNQSEGHDPHAIAGTEDTGHH